MNTSFSSNDTSLYPGVSSQDAKVVTALFVDVGLGLLLLLGFLLLRRRVPEMFEARCNDPVSPSRPGKSIIGWIVSATLYDNELWLLKCFRGLDAVLYLMLIRYLFYAMAPCLLFEFIVLVPIYATSTPPVNATTGGLSRISLGNVGPDDKNRLWAALVTVIVNSVWCFFVLYKLYYAVTARRIQHRSLKRVENYTALLRELPTGVTARELGSHFDLLLPNQVVAISVALKSRRLPKLFAERASVLRELERCVWRNAERERRVRVWHGSRFLGDLFNGEDAVQYWSNRLAAIDADIAQKQRKRRPGAGVAFLTLKSIRSAQILWQTVVHAGEFDNRSLVPWPWVTEAPPPPSAMVYSGLHVSGKQRFVRLVAVDFINVCVMVAFYIPIAFLVGISTTNSSLNDVPLIGQVVNLVPAAEGIIRGFLPSLGISLCSLIMLHIVLGPLVSLVGFLDWATVHRSILSRFYVYQVFNTLLGATVGGALVNVLQAVVTSPYDVIVIIAKSIPRQSTFFITYVMLLAFTDPFFNLLMPFSFIIRLVKRTLFCVTPRDYRETNGPWVFDFYEAVWPLVVFVLCMAYAIISPLILIFGCVYYFFTYYCVLYQYVYVFTEHRSSNGFIFPTLFAMACWAIVIFQVVSFSSLAFLEFPFAAIILPVIAISIAFFYLVQYQFSAIAKFGSLSQEPEIDDVIPPPECYLQPWMLPPTEVIETAEASDDGVVTAPEPPWLTLEGHAASSTASSRLRSSTVTVIGNDDSAVDPERDTSIKMRRFMSNPLDHDPHVRRAGQGRHEEPVAPELLRDRTKTSFFVMNRAAGARQWARPEWSSSANLLATPDTAVLLTPEPAASSPRELRDVVDDLQMETQFAASTCALDK